MPNDLNQRSREVAELVEDWEKLFNAFNVPAKRKNGVLYAKCPDCRAEVKVRPNERRGFPTWQCGACGAHKKHHDSFLGLLAAYNPHGSRGQLLGEVESWALRSRLVKPLPKWKFDFGKYNGELIAAVPANYSVWAAQNCSMPEEVKRGVFEAFDLPVPEDEESKFLIQF